MPKRIVLAILGVLPICIVVGWFLFSQLGRFFAMLIWVSITGNWDPPPIAEGQITENDWSHFENGSRKFTAILVRRFPVGSNEVILKSTLSAQGFENPPPPKAGCIPEGQDGPVGRDYSVCPRWDTARTMEYYWGGLCGPYLSARWASDVHGRITHIEGYYGPGECM